MNFRAARPLLVLFCLLAFPFASPAPFVYRPGEGWSYEAVGGDSKWRMLRAQDQLEVAQAAFKAEKYGLALKAAKRVVLTWPLAEYAPEAQYLVGRCYELAGKHERAFKEYQKLLEKYPRIDKYDEVLRRQYDLTTRFYEGEWFRLLGYVPVPPVFSGQSDKTIGMYEKVIKNGMYSEVAPEAQIKIGATRERQSDYLEAVRAYQVAADRYHDRAPYAADALFRAAKAYEKQAVSSEYDQSNAGQAINSFSDFMALYPEDPRVAQAEQSIAVLRTEQARGSYLNAKFYERKHQWAGARVYYGEVLLKDPNSPYSAEARQRLEALDRRLRPGDAGGR